MIWTVDGLRAFARSYKARRRQDMIDSVVTYFSYRSKPNLVRILNSTPLDALEGEVRIARDLIDACRPRSPCGLYGCCSCGRRFKRKAKMEMLKKITARCGGLPDPEAISFVTINGPRVALEPAAVEAAFETFWTRVRTLQKKKLRDTSWIGFFDISLNGMLHWHGLILHPSGPGKSLKPILREVFPEDLAVKVSEWEQEKTFWENLDSVVDYSLVADKHAKVLYGRPIHGRETASLVAKRIVCLQYMARRGVQGIRLSLNMSSSRRWKAGVMYDSKTGEVIVVPEMEEMILRRRKKARKNREWNRKNRIALWPRRKATDPIQGERRRKATDQIRGVRPLATG